MMTFIEEIIKKKRFQIGVLLIRSSDVPEEDTLK